MSDAVPRFVMSRDESWSLVKSPELNKVKIEHTRQQIVSIRTVLGKSTRNTGSGGSF